MFWKHRSQIPVPKIPQTSFSFRSSFDSTNYPHFHDLTPGLVQASQVAAERILTDTVCIKVASQDGKRKNCVFTTQVAQLYHMKELSLQL